MEEGWWRIFSSLKPPIKLYMINSPSFEQYRIVLKLELDKSLCDGPCGDFILCTLWSISRTSVRCCGTSRTRYTAS